MRTVNATLVGFEAEQSFVTFDAQEVILTCNLRFRTDGGTSIAVDSIPFREGLRIGMRAHVAIHFEDEVTP